VPCPCAYECSPQDLPAAFSRTLRALGRQQQHADSRARFGAALGLHASAVSSRDSAVHVTALWAALEALLPIGADDVKITAVLSNLVPILCRHHALRLMAELENDLTRCVPDALDRARELAPLGVTAELKLAAVVAVDELESARDVLYAALSRNPLLMHRVFVLKKKTETAKHTLEAIMAHKQKVEWQIKRIYRSRNLLVHAGRSLPYLPTVVENLHAYLHAVFEGIEEKFMHSPPRNLNAALLSMKLESDEHILYLRSLEEAKTSTDNLLSILAGPVLSKDQSREESPSRLAEMLATWGRRTAT
jgi:hypothetical protein